MAEPALRCAATSRPNRRLDACAMIDTRVDEIDALLPQTQCTRCGQPTCRDYARAMLEGRAEINQCPPGGSSGIAALAKALRRAPLPLNPAHGIESASHVAVIDESRCIGCAKCIPPCPVDAIVGAQRFMHTVVAALCTGCELCIAACPVDCISLQPREDAAPQTRAPDADENRARFRARNERLAHDEAERATLLAERKRLARGPAPR